MAVPAMDPKLQATLMTVGLLISGIVGVGTLFSGFANQGMKLAPENRKWFFGGVAMIGAHGAAYFFFEAAGRPWVLGSLGGVIVLGIGLVVGTRLERRRSPKSSDSTVDRVREVASRFVQEMHRRWFPRGPDLDRSHRVSLFMPESIDAKRAWVCIARTTRDATAAKRWPEVMDLGARARAGLVNFAVTEQRGVLVAGVPDGRRKDHEELERYLAESCISKEDHANRSWPWATLLVRVARGRHGQILCVIVVEREDGEPIKLARGLELVEKGPGIPDPIPHDVCTWELQLAADVWAALRDER